MGKKVHYNAEIVPFAVCFDICKITDPDNIRSLLVEILLEMIGTSAVFIVFVRMKRLLGRIEEAVHSSDAEEYMLQAVCYSRHRFEES